MKDAERQIYLENMGWRVLRITTAEARSDDNLIDIVRSALRPSPRGEGIKGWGEAQPLGEIATPRPPPPPLEGRGSVSSSDIPTRLQRRTRSNRTLKPRSHA